MGLEKDRVAGASDRTKMAKRILDIKREGGRSDRKPSASAPAYFSSLTVKNIRCFGPKQTLDLTDGEGRPAQWTVILGDNGVGKTTLLQSLAALLPVEDSVFKDDSDKKGIVPRYAEEDKLRDAWEPFRSGTDSFLIVAAFAAGVSLEEGRAGDEIPNFGVEGFREDGSFVDLRRFDELRDVVTCFGYGAARHMGRASLSTKSQEDPTATLFSDDTSLVNAEEWLLQADYMASKKSPIQQQAIQRRDRIKDALLRLLPDVADIRFLQPSDNQMKLGIEVETPYGWVAIGDLSLGYTTLIAWTVDMASRLFERYPDSPNPLNEPAIVLVDEIDLHLHPRWQRSLMGYLSELFPNTQFIVTAHSPLVVQAATDANIVVLRREGDHVIIDNDAQSIRGWRIDQVLTSDLFGLESARPPAFDDLLAKRKAILSKGKMTTRDKQNLRKIEAQIGSLPAGETPADIEAMDIIRRAADRLR